jgi:hypothetical protein
MIQALIRRDRLFAEHSVTKKEIFTSICLEIENEISIRCLSDHFSEIGGLASRQILPSFAAMFSGVFA